MQKFELTRAESLRLENLLNVARIQEEILGCITDSYRNYIVGIIFPRIKADPKNFPKTVINIGTGELIINEADPVPEKTMKAEVKGDKK
jgi:hypothetical protein